MPSTSKAEMTDTKVAASASDVSGDESIVEDFFAKLEFFCPHIDTAVNIFRLSKDLSEDYVRTQCSNLAPAELNPADNGVLVVKKSWMSEIIQRVSTILFHEDESISEEVNLSVEEMSRFFQRVLSEKIYNHLSMLAHTPHAKSGQPFSIREELTEGIAENIGLGLYIDPETPQDLRERAGNALLDLSWEFQQWLVQRGGDYPATWGVIEVIGEPPVTAAESLLEKIFGKSKAETVAGAKVMLIPDVDREKEIALFFPQMRPAMVEEYSVAAGASAGAAESA